MWADLIQQFSAELTPEMWKLVALSTWQTVYMSVTATFLAVMIGVPIGFLAFLTGQGQILQQKTSHRLLNIIINIGRSIPFIILLVLLFPVTRFLVGTVLGSTAAIIPLAITAMPFVARLTANALMEVPTGLTEAGKSMGATHWQIVSKYYFPESLPILINGITLTLVTLIGYSAMAGAVGGGGLGNLAISYGEHRNMVYVKWVATIIIVAFVMICQKMGDHLAQRFDHR